MFHNLIKEVWAGTPGLENLILSGVDGIAVSKHHESEESDFLAAEAANLVKESQRFGDELKCGSLASMVTQYENLIIVIQMVTSDYFLLGVLKDPKHLALVRYRFTLVSYDWYPAIA